MQFNQRLEILRDGVYTVVEEHAQDAIIDIIDRYEDLVENPEQLPEDSELVEDMKEIERVIAQHYAPFRAALDSEKLSEAQSTQSREISFWELQTIYSCDVNLEIKYTDMYGEETQRKVHVTAFGKDENVGCFAGYCNLRNAPRTFRYDRVGECIDIDSGEVVVDIHGHLMARYEKSPQRAMDIMQTDNADILRILFYVGKADGTLRAAERAIILVTCHRFTGDSRITDDMLQNYLRSIERPTIQAFNLAVARLASSSFDKRTWLIDAAERIVATQKSAHPDEIEAIQYLHNRLGKMT